MNSNRDSKIGKIVRLTIEMLFLLTGEDYMSVKKTSSEPRRAPVYDIWERPLSPIRDPSPNPPIPEDINEQKILELIHKMIELLTGEVPIRCQDVAVYFSMEEWEYLEGHKDLYKDVMMEVPQPLRSPDDSTRSSEGLWIDSDVETDDHATSPDACEEHTIKPDVPSVLQSRKVLSDSDEVPSQNSLQTVQNENLKRNDEHPVAPTVEKPFSCLQCKKMFKLKSALVIHQRIHNREKFLSCRECGKCFGQKADLVKHMKSHPVEQQFSCSECGRRCDNEVSLSLHQRVHLLGKQFFCLVCGKRFRRDSYCVAHERTHLKQMPFSCSECWRSFSCKAALFMHLKTHKGEKQSSNLACGKRFTKEMTS
ncbi:uncharacterized protein [Dendrobates tinctorius]|uniref:uncharacterized protein n=1 Tax=Dendrobates tinctorius TaxID=92724 RepID=UPI003CC9D7C6